MSVLTTSSQHLVKKVHIKCALNEKKSPQYSPDTSLLDREDSEQQSQTANFLMGEFTRMPTEQSDAPSMAHSSWVNLSTSWLGPSFQTNQSRNFMVMCISILLPSFVKTLNFFIVNTYWNCYKLHGFSTNSLLFPQAVQIMTGIFCIFMWYLLLILYMGQIKGVFGTYEPITYKTGCSLWGIFVSRIHFFI